MYLKFTHIIRMLTAVGLGCVLAIPKTEAAAVGISTVPIFATTASTTEVKPNVFQVMDDSGSMAWDYMPDIVGNWWSAYGKYSSQCNGLAYNPNITYTAPLKYDGSSYPNASFTSASEDVYNANATVHDLTWSTYYVYSGTQTSARQKNYNDSNSIFYKECASTLGSTTKVDGTHPVNTIFTQITVGATSGPGGKDERTNYANWYSMYRTRILMMKTSSGLAMNNLTSHFRVGFMTINNNTGNDLLNISDFSSTGSNSQRQQYYSKLYATQANNSTPLREALSATGRMYAGKVPTYKNKTLADPVQYACQQNYTILSTDGYWNGNDNQVFKLDGSTVMDNQDGTLPRPYYDGALTTATTVTPYTSTKTVQTVTTAATRTVPWSKTVTTVGSSCTSGGTPANTTSAPMVVDSSGSAHTAGLAVSGTNPDNNNNHCYNLGSNVWFCRGSSNQSSAANQSTATGTNGVTWYLVSSGATNSGCVTSSAAFGGGNYSLINGVCPSTTVSGKYVTVTPYTLTETISGYTNTSVDLYTATNQSTTQVTTNGVAGATGALTPATPSYTYTGNISNTSTYSTDTCAGTSNGAPCAPTAGTWVAGTPTTNNQCVATASLPTAGTSAATAGTATNSGTSTSTSILSTTGPTAGTATVTSTSTGGTSDTLADVSAYYYNTNLRTTALNNCSNSNVPTVNGVSNNLCTTNTVPAYGLDTATWQHMTTFTVGLGVSGDMVYSKTYLKDVSVSGAPSDYYDVANGKTASSTNCTWQASGACNWPTPSADNLTAVDDLWHAAVNGHGTYYAASNPQDLANGLTSALNTIINTPQPGTASASATTNPKITSTSDYQFSSYFKTVEWSGELIRQTMSLVDGTVPYYNPSAPDASTYDWSAQTLLDSKSAGTGYTSRNIYFGYSNSSGKPTMALFNWANLGTAGQTGKFTNVGSTSTPSSFPTILSGLSQFCTSGSTCISTTAQAATTVATGGASGEALVNFLRGDRSNEDGTTNSFYRSRAHVLGDIVSAQPQYVGPPSQTLGDAGYSDYKTSQASRSPVVFAAANDGMLHAFDVASGSENWAYIPSFVLPRIFTLADKNYSNNHQYFVEGTPATGDICPKAPTGTCAGSDWKTILVGGLSAGGTGYYALDVTSPTTPALLWEFTDSDMGFTFGKPQIAKLDDGTWVVMVTSGYNNCQRSATDNTTAAANCTRSNSATPSSTGQGYLYILNAATGAQIAKISTGQGSNTTPSGIAQIVAQVSSSSVSQRVYGGDLLGNVWRFNISTTAGNYSNTAQALASLVDASGNAQPVMDRPQVSTVNGYPVVFLGTGQYLSSNDVGNTKQQSFYAIKDTFGTTSYNNVRNNSGFISLTAVATTCPVGVSSSICSPNSVVRSVTQNNGSSGDSLVNKTGWYLDFASGAGELEFTDPKLVLGTLVFTTSVPKASSSVACAPRNTGSDGDALMYEMNYLNGQAVGTTSNVIATTVGTGIATAPQISQLPNGVVISKVRLSTGVETTQNIRISAPTTTKRVSWRELVSP